MIYQENTKQDCTGIIIDDEVDLREAVTEYLEKRGIKIIGNGSNGCHADHLFKEKQPDFVLLDLNMPDYDGLYAIEKIKEQNPQAKIFIITGRAEYSYEESKVVRVIQKPFNLEKLANIICKSVCN